MNFSEFAYKFEKILIESGYKEVPGVISRYTNFYYGKTKYFQIDYDGYRLSYTNEIDDKWLTDYEFKFYTTHLMIENFLNMIKEKAEYFVKNHKEECIRNKLKDLEKDFV